MHIKIFFIALFIFPLAVLAHQPRLVDDLKHTIISNPEVSQAFYGELNGQPATYQINSDQPFNLYLGILVPNVENIDKDVSLRVYVKNKYEEWEPAYFLDGLQFNWLEFHEEFGNDDYFKGPELKSDELLLDYPQGVEVVKGSYLIEVFSPDNYGQYVLAVGEREEFPLREMFGSFSSLAKIKKDFFNKPFYAIFYSKIFFYLFLLILLVMTPIIVLIVWLVLNRKRRQF